MDLWIRSQNKKRLIKVDLVEYDKQIDGPTIIYSHEYLLGEYKTKERALEVLDEIQELIKPKIITTQYQCAIEDNKKTEFNLIMNPLKTEIQELSTIVYEMPQE